jgi:hypothetical protein
MKAVQRMLMRGAAFYLVLLPAATQACTPSFSFPLTPPGNPAPSRAAGHA